MTEGKECICSCEDFRCHQLGPEKSHIYHKKTSGSSVKNVGIEQCLDYQIQKEFLSGREIKVYSRPI